MQITFSSLNQRNNQSGDYLAIDAGELHCFVAIEFVDKVFSLVALQPVPDAPDYLVGVMNYRGVAVPVIDLLLRLGQVQASSYTVETPMVVCNTQDGGSQIGIIVSNIGTITHAEADNVQMNSEFKQKKLPFTGFLNQPEQSGLILNTESLSLTSLSFMKGQSPEEVRQALQDMLGK